MFNFTYITDNMRVMSRVRVKINKEASIRINNVINLNREIKEETIHNEESIRKNNFSKNTNQTNTQQYLLSVCFLISNSLIN